jgi:AcrR family transcriptional regulator
VFAEFGYEAATFQAIAVEIGLTRPAINNYFSSKADLYSEVVCRVSNTVRAANQLASRAPTLSDQVLTFIRVAFRADDGDPSLPAFLVQAAMDVQHLPDGECQAAALVEQFVRAAVGSAVRRGEVDGDPEALTDMLLGLLWGAAFQIGRGNSERADRMLDQLCGMLDQGLVR